MIVCESSLIIEEKGNIVRGKEEWSLKKKPKQIRIDKKNINK
jgi:hypothetical protein